MTVDGKMSDEKLQSDINREAAKISALSSRTIDKYEFLTGEEVLPPDQRRVIAQAKFPYSPLGKTFEKQTKTVEDQGKNQIKLKIMENSWLDLMKLKRFLISTEIVCHLMKKKKYLIDLSKKNLMNFRKEKINRNNLIYKYKTVRRGPKYFSDYQNLIDLFINSRDGNVNSREVLKNKIDFKSDLGKIKKGNPKSKSEDQK